MADLSGALLIGDGLGAPKLDSLLRGGVGGRECLPLGAPYGEEARDRILLNEGLPLASTNDPVFWSTGFPVASKDTDCVTTLDFVELWIAFGSTKVVGALVFTTASVNDALTYNPRWVSPD